MSTSAFISEWQSLTSDPSLRLRAVRDYANLVFGEAAIADAWLRRPHRAVRGGIVAVGVACQTIKGFLEAIAELTRIEQAQRQEALALAQGTAGDQDGPVIHDASASSVAARSAASLPPLRTGT